MCGISGLAGFRTADAAAAVDAMNGLIAHRGPDGAGIFHEDGIALGHRRLAIVDLSDAGHQPMHRDDRYVISYNGEIYNHVELRAELARLGHRFSSQTDTEVILAAYSQWGRDCLHRFNGMWAFLLYDRREKTLFAARDRFGVKPLYYWASTAGFVAFASEIKQFTVLPGWQARLNHQRAYDFLNWGLTDHTDETLFAGVFQLRGGQSLLVDAATIPAAGARMPVQSWYRLPEGESAISYDAAVAGLRSTLADAVRLRLRADVAVGSCLSGGIDSSSIVCLIHGQLDAQHASGKQNTFSACSHEKRFDEREHMEAVTRRTGATPHYTYPSLDALFAQVDALVWHQDEPFGSSSIFAQWEVFRLAAANDVKVMLDGQGADEQLAGYTPFWGALIAGLVRKGALVAAWREFSAAQRRTGLAPVALLRHVVNELAPAPLRALLRRLAGFGALAPRWINRDVLHATPANPFARDDAPAADPVNALCRSQLLATNLQMLLHWEDRNSMAHSLEARVPFLDYRLAEFLAGLPGAYKIGDGYTKRVLRDAMRDVIPDSIRLRTDKLGFATPEEVWLRGNSERFAAAVDKAIDESAGILNNNARAELQAMLDNRIPFSALPWRIICFGAWMRIYKVGT